MNDQQTVSREIVIVNRLGLHARAAAKFVSAAQGFAARIRLRHGEREVDGKSIMGLLMLAAAKGTRLQLNATGHDAEQAADRLEELIMSRFGEDD